MVPDAQRHISDIITAIFEHKYERSREVTAMVDVGALQAAYNDAVAKGNKKLAEQLLALWRDARSPGETASAANTDPDPYPAAARRQA